MPITLDQIVASDRLPSLPEVAMRVIELARDPVPDFDEVIRAVRTDPALSSKMLRTANSALFGLRRPVKSIDAVIPLLGITLVRTIVLGFTLANQRPSDEGIRRPWQKLWRSSLTQAVFAELIAMDSISADPPTYFLAGLLQDIGILAAMHVDKDNYLTHVWELSDFPNVAANERQYYGFTHLNLAHKLCAQWGIPEEIREAIVTHHSRMQITDSASPLATALQAANLCAQYIENLHKPGDRAFDDLVAFLTLRYDWPLEKTEDVLRETNMRVGETAALFRFDVGAGHSTERILDDAKRILEEIALHSQLQSIVATKDTLREADEAPAHQQAKLEDEVMRDALTGAFNRRFLDRRLNERLSRDIRHKKPMGFLFLDIDRFKGINDEYGHQAGDKAICRVARIISQAVRKSDFVIRYGGDEFLVALMQVSEGVVESVAERICEEIRDARVGELSIRMTTSIGALHYQPESDDPSDASWLIDYVDKAMYEAKKNGGDQVQLYHIQGENQLVASDMA